MLLVGIIGATNSKQKINMLFDSQFPYVFHKPCPLYEIRQASQFSG